MVLRACQNLRTLYGQLRQAWKAFPVRKRHQRKLLDFFDAEPVNRRVASSSLARGANFSFYLNQLQTVDRMPHLFSHSELVTSLGLRARVSHPVLHNGIWSDLTKTGTEDVSQVVKRKCGHACSAECCLPSCLYRRKWSIRVNRTRKEIGGRCKFSLPCDLKNQRSPVCGICRQLNTAPQIRNTPVHGCPSTKRMAPLG